MKKAYIGKQGQVLFEFKPDGGKEELYYAVYPHDFRFRIDEDGKVYVEEYKFDVEDDVVEIDKETFEKENTGKSVVFVDGGRDYEEMVDFILDYIDDLIKEELEDLIEEELEEKGNLDNLDKEYLLYTACQQFLDNLDKEYLLYSACQQFIYSMSDYYDTELLVYVRGLEGSPLIGFKLYEMVGTELDPDILKKETKEWILEDVIPDEIEKIKEEIKEKIKEKIKKKNSGPIPR